MTSAEPVIRAAGKQVAASAAVIGRVHVVAQEGVGRSYRWERIAALNLTGRGAAEGGQRLDGS